MLTERERGATITAGTVVLAVIALLLAAAVLPLLGATGSGAGASRAFDAYTWRITRFTLEQAALSTGLSVLFAIPVASALGRRQAFFGRRWLVRLLALPLGLPQIVAALGIIEIWGRQGLLNSAWTASGLGSPFSIYGLPGILVAHVFFNMPLVARLLLLEIERLPGEYWSIAATLGMRRRDTFRFVEWPAMARVLPGIASLVFMLCITSFTVVLLLGGGPAATTLEVAIYQALHFDFDPPRAVMLALLQIGLTALVIVLLRLLGRDVTEGLTSGRNLRRHDRDTVVSRLLDGSIVLVAGAFLLAPLLAIAADGLSADIVGLAGQPIVWRAAGTSLAVAFCAALLAVTTTLVLVAMRAALRPGMTGWLPARALHSAASAATSLILLVPPIVLGAGWFLLLHDRIDVFALAPIVVVVVNALMALPFVIRVLEPAFSSHRARTSRLSLSLGIAGVRRWRVVDWPALSRPIAISFAFAMALSLGDLGAIALYGSPDTVTLPYLLLQRMGSYRTSDAAGLAFILGLLCLVLMVLGTRQASKQAT